MQEANDLFILYIRIMENALADPVFLVLVALTLVAGFWSSWLIGTVGLLIFAGARIAVVDWLQFVPGTPPSPLLLHIFVGTLLILLPVFALGRVVRAVSRAWTSSDEPT